MNKDIKWEIVACIGFLFLIAFSITSNLHCWDKPYNWDMFKYLTKIDWILFGLGAILMKVGCWKLKDYEG